jgi:hypothetical protein
MRVNNPAIAFLSTLMIFQGCGMSQPLPPFLIIAESITHERYVIEILMSNDSCSICPGRYYAARKHN